MSEVERQATGSGPTAIRLPWRTVGLGVCLAWLATCLFFVEEHEAVIVERLGEIVAVFDNPHPTRGDRGLHVKWPWPIGTVRRFDRRQQLFDPPGREMFTRDRRNVTVSAYVCWRIAEREAESGARDGAGDGRFADRPSVKFFRGLGSVPVAESRIEARVRSTLSAELGRIDLSELLKVGSSEEGPESGDAASPLAQLAERALEQLRQRGDHEALDQRLGIEIVDLRIRRLSLPEGNRFAVYQRMQTERERIAERFRSAGRAERARIESHAKLQSEKLLAEAEADAERIRGEGEAEAIRILNAVHAQDPEFFEFQRTLATYTRILTERSTLVLSASSPLFRLLTEGVRLDHTAPRSEGDEKRSKPTGPTATERGGSP